MSQLAALARILSTMTFTLAWGCAVSTSPLRAEPDPPAQQALLVGCSDYTSAVAQPLRGPVNDVADIRKMLVTRFGFAETNIIKLDGTAADPTRRPTYKNIMEALKRCADSARANQQIVLWFSGHGTQFPIPQAQTDLLDPQNPEPDGYDEAFLPVDFDEANGGVLRDNELGSYIDQMLRQGAHVWAVFDCCHSGTLTRGAPDETSRSVDGSKLGVSAEEIQRVSKLVKKNPPQVGKREEVDPWLATGSSVSGNGLTGTLVAFFASQPYEEAPELPLPLNVPRTAQRVHGLLSYQLMQALEDQDADAPVTYAKLGERLVTNYRAMRDVRGPTPSYMGAVNREVLGLKDWPAKPRLTLQQDGDLWRVTGGELHGVTPGSILGVYDPTVADSTKTQPLAYVKVNQATATSSTVIGSASPDEKVPPRPGILAAGMICKVLQRELGELRLKVGVVLMDDKKAATDIACSALEVIRNTSDRLVPLKIVDEKSAEWLVRIGKREGLAAPNGSYRFELVHRSAQEAAATATPKLASSYAAADPNELAIPLRQDLTKIFAWQNLLKVAADPAVALTDSHRRLELHMTLAKSAIETDFDNPFTGNDVPMNQRMNLLVRNRGIDKLWVTLLYLDADFSIKVLPKIHLNFRSNDGAEIGPYSVVVDRPGLQGWMAIVTSADQHAEEPDYDFLAQLGLGKDTPPVALKRDLNSAFDQLAYALAGRGGQFRAVSTGENPLIVTRTWVVAAEPCAK